MVCTGNENTHALTFFQFSLNYIIYINLFSNGNLNKQSRYEFLKINDRYCLIEVYLQLLFPDFLKNYLTDLYKI